VKDAIKRVPGVGDVNIFGERKYAMRVWLDPLKLAAQGLTATDVISALIEQNVEIPAGQLGQQPADTKQAFQIPVRVVGRLSSPEEFDDIILKSSDKGLILLSSVGHAEIGAEDYSYSSTTASQHKALEFCNFQTRMHLMWMQARKPH
jgi:HAE1 family hydrophobic/amphiphilic exporter-1